MRRLTPMGELLIRDVRLVGIDGPVSDGVVDVRLADGRVTEVGPALAAFGHEEHRAEGRWMVPGLWDAHVHHGQWAATVGRLDGSRADSPEALLGLVAERVAREPGTPVVGSGHPAGHWRNLTVNELDAVTGGTPTVLISSDCHQAWLNSSALALLGLPWRDDVVREAEWFDVFQVFEERISGRVGNDDYRAVQLAAARIGVVGLVDFEYTGGPHEWPLRHAADAVVLRVRASTYADGLDAVLATGLHTGDVVPGTGGLVTAGPLKVIGDGSLNTRTAWCCDPYAGTDTHGAANLPADELVDLLRRASAGGLECNVHAIGDAAAQVTLDAFERTGARGSIEHAQLIRPDQVRRMAALGVRASVQPAHLLDDRDLSELVWPGRGADCFPLRTMLDAGVDVRMGSDAPVARLDPWLAMAAAVHRSVDGGEAWHPEQQITAREALAASTDGLGTVAAGHPADLVLLDTNPLADVGEPVDVADHLRSTEVAATWVAGRRVH